MHQITEFKVRGWKNGHRQVVKLCSGEVVFVTRVPKGFLFSYKGQTIEVPKISPHSKKSAVLVAHDLPHVIAVWYGSCWPECQLMTCAAGIVLITSDGFSALPEVKPEAYVVMKDFLLSQMIISRVERSPFGQPCAAILDTGNITANIKAAYVFPQNEPIIVESHAATAGFGRVHDGSNPGTGAMCGDVPYLYPWISPDRERHGWVLALAGEWEVIGKRRPREDEPQVEKRSDISFFPANGGKVRRELLINHIPAPIADRSIFCDALDSDDELYDINLGEENVLFSRFNVTESPRGMYSRFNMDMTAYRDRKNKLASGALTTSCACPDKEPGRAQVSFAMWKPT